MLILSRTVEVILYHEFYTAILVLLDSTAGIRAIQCIVCYAKADENEKGVYKKKLTNLLKFVCWAQVMYGLLGLIYRAYF